MNPIRALGDAETAEFLPSRPVGETLVEKPVTIAVLEGSHCPRQESLPRFGEIKDDSCGLRCLQPQRRAPQFSDQVAVREEFKMGPDVTDGVCGFHAA